MDLYEVVRKIEISDDKARILVAKYSAQTTNDTGNQGSTDWIARRVIRRYARECAAIGGVTAVPGAIPGPSTALAIAAAAPDIATCMKLQVDMCKCLAIVYGYDISKDDNRRIYYLIAATGKLNHGVRKPAINMGTKAGVRLLRQHLKGAALNAVKEAFKRVGVTFTRKAVEKALPFGIGITISSAANWFMTLFVGKQAKKWFEIDSAEGQGGSAAR